jgi:hypothetical protein
VIEEALTEVESELDQELEQVSCKFCQRPAPRGEAHVHQDGFVGECCWDERLRVSE